MMERVGLVPAAIPNWESGVTLEYAYQTAILTSRDGTEQRMALRQQPRATMRYRSLMRPERIYRHYADLTKNIDQLFTVPMRWKSEPITVSTASTITVDAVPFWAIVGARVVVANETIEEASEITAINGTDLSVETTITDPTTLYAAAHGRYEDSVQVDAETSSVWTLDVQFAMEPGQIVPVTTITPDSFEGIDVFPFGPNWREAGELEFTSERETLDHDLGVISVRNPRTYITETIRHRFSLFNAQTTDEMLAFFVRQKGKRGEFWVPTDRADMEAIAPVSAGGTEIEVNSRDLGTYMADSPVYN
ncbi:MAG: hypothetical protein GVY29_00410, partial [Spirochaetes bacterium]|nr:hypothetical protein [Spirochaetota bacterium]